MTTQRWIGAVLPLEDPRQGLRVRRFLLAALVYALAIAMLGLYVRQGLLYPHEWQFLALIIVLFNGVIYALLRSGRNERFADPSLTGIQMILVCIVMGLTMYLIDSGRGGMLLVYLVLLMFGVLRLNPRQFTAVGGFALVCYASAMAAVWQQRPEAFNAQVELLHLAALSTLVPCGGFFASHVSGLRRQLRERQIELQRAQENVHDLTVLDSLTRVSNRSAIVNFLEQERARAVRLDQPLALVLVDLVRFKQVNRQFGHPVGDELLRQVATQLRKNVRDIDGVGRYGGEEFLLVLPDTAQTDATAIAARVKECIQRVRAASVPADFVVRARVGVAMFAGEENIWEFIEQARSAATPEMES
ncbi:diguanylate cyclase [Spiribacter sp. C176]|uniref:diguanylate cyclase n=1 Tax=Spiribacter salilacus TaxID=2664894 RepID=A0A6N7QTE5_9GAMM|nr:GGDEF domain-containing protein [Spiribacter salilacus]MRH78860.1 diguanylate cyclase [Spiribacter salilacus]